MKKIALISVYNKEGIVDFAKELADLGFQILASGGTAKVLSDAGIETSDVASLVGGSAILGHRVVTLSREIHAGLLARDTAEDRAELERLKIPRIDLVCVDLYPLEEEIQKADSRQQTADSNRDAVIEKTDIGGPTMIRSAAKGRRIVVCDPADRSKTIEWLKNGEPDRENFISSLVAKAEFVVANYCLASAEYHGNGKFSGVLGQEILRAKYGENGWQIPAGLFADKSARYKDALSLANFKVVGGTSPSYNNVADIDRLLQTITHIAAGFDTNFHQSSPPPNLPHKDHPKLASSLGNPNQGGGRLCIAVGVKHGNPCGAAISDNPSSAIQKMLEGDLRAIFGGLVMVNFEIDENLAEVLLTYKMESGRRLLDGIAAPAFTQGAVEMLKRKGDKCRFLVNPALENLNAGSIDIADRFRYVRGGFLKQPNYKFILELPPAPSFAKRGGEQIGETSESQKKDLLLAWAIGCTSNSNTVTIVKDQMLLGNGVGQQDRVGCCELAIKRAKDAGHGIAGAAAYSDSFFPFVDAVKVLSDAKISVIFATSGSVRDPEIKKFCKDNEISLVTLPDSQARGFFGH